MFEANDRAGGKVWSYTDEQGRVAEFGQAGFSWKYQHSLHMAGRLGLELIPAIPGLPDCTAGAAHEQLDLGVALREATDWSRQVLAAAGIADPSTLAELRGHPDLGCGIDTWCRHTTYPRLLWYGGIGGPGLVTAPSMTPHQPPIWWLWHL